MAKERLLFIPRVALALETKKRLFRKDMGSLTCLRAHPKKVQEHTCLILRFNTLFDQRFYM